MGGKAVEVFSGSRLVVGQVQRELEVKDPRMQEYLSQVRHLQSGFESFNLSQVLRNRITHADSLTTLATFSAQGLPQTKAVNKVIVSGLKKRLDDAKGKWVEELPHVLWTYRTTPHRSTRETPFSMTYGAEAVIPLETRFPTLRTSSFTPNSNDVLLEKSLDLIEERREIAMIQLAYYQHKLKQGYDANVKLRPLTVGDLVLRLSRFSSKCGGRCSGLRHGYLNRRVS
ncbi:uncharacterized protein LOC115964691 [Quercus lobata]|uniref:uncharacterized protein LOC115964691 n=1 Tax=Quercus lobata TaxID=97700 RepID=UPI001248F84C|nr:uncharacterized protein LOC115964691 [Quercus lobata]